jgi:predicted esterase
MHLDINIGVLLRHACAQISKRQVLSMSTQRPPRILMLHGYGQNGAIFERKVDRFMKSIRPTIARHYNVPSSQIKLFFPDGPIVLKPSDVRGGMDDAAPRTDYENHLRCWWHNLDTVSNYPGLELSLAALKKIVVEQGPFSGIIGFSQGAALAGMYTSWCQSSADSAFVAAFEGGKHHSTRILADVLSEPLQPPLDFAILLSGFCGTAEYYSDFYLSSILTPSVHVNARFDTMVEHWQTSELIRAFEQPEVVEHQGVHHVPTEKRILECISSALQHAISRRRDSFAEVDSQADTLVSSISSFDQKAKVTHTRVEYSRSNSSIARRRYKISNRSNGKMFMHDHRLKEEQEWSIALKTARYRIEDALAVAYVLPNSLQS